MQEYVPTSIEVKKIHDSLQKSLAENKRLNVGEWTHTVGNVTRVFRRYMFSGIELQLLLGDSEYDEISVESRSTPADPKDPTWVRVDLRIHGIDDPDEALSRTLEYMLDWGMNRMDQYSITKHLPTFDIDDPVNGSQDNMNDEEADFFAQLEEQARSITQEDVRFLGQLAHALAE